MTAGAVFSSLVGQEPVVEQLSRAVAAAADRSGGTGGMTHAWLFTGPPGSGRSVAARGFAAALLCGRSGCGECPSCRQVAVGSHADLLLVRPDGLSYGVRQTRDLVLKAATAPVSGRWRVVLFEDADRATEQAANALLKAIEEPVAADGLAAVRPVRRRPADHDPVPLPAGHAAHPADRRGRRRAARRGHRRRAAALEAARAADGHIGRARRLATDPEAARRRADVLAVPFRTDRLGDALAAADALVKAAKAEADAVTAELDEPERDAMRRAFGEGSTGKGVATALRGAAGALRDLEARQKSRATRVQRDSLDRALLDLAGFYRDVLAIQLGSEVDLANEGQREEIGRLAAATGPEVTVRRIEAIMRCRERLAVDVAPLLAVEEMTIALVDRLGQP